MGLNIDAPFIFISDTINKLKANKSRYQGMTAKTGVPWYFIACIHQLEAGGSFMKHLHNGDWLIKRTVHVPVGRPADSNPPYTWECSAYDALVNCKGLNKVTDWSIPHMLFLLEGYNGYGYRVYHPTVKSPYLWGKTNHYTKGKYIADNHFDPNAVSQQIGAAVILKGLLYDEARS